MADVVLMNKDGSPVGYSPVPDKISVPGHDHDNKETTYKYTRFAAMKMYSVRPVDGGFMVTKRFLNLPSDNYWFNGFTESELLQYGHQDASGDNILQFVITSKELTVGNVYTINELYD